MLIRTTGEFLKMNIITVIGTRPQYIKLKPFHDYCKDNNIFNYIIDTNQHYSDNVSKNLVKELDLKIDCNLKVKYNDEISFISNSIISISNKLKELDFNRKDSIVIVVGDTNSTLVSALVAKKMGFKLAHIEAGIRCHNPDSPEEINRVTVDSIADIHFTSREKDGENVSNPFYVGDLEYSFLNSIIPVGEEVSYDGPILMTIHRQENMVKSRLVDLFEFCKKIKYPIIFPMHHRTKKYIEKNKIVMPYNIKEVEPVGFFELIGLLKICRGVITDSGGITKTVPFFGKKAIVPMNKWEWDEVFKLNYATNKLDLDWFDDCKMSRNLNLYYVENSCELIINKIS